MEPTPIQTELTSTPAAPSKPGVKTSEFWLATFASLFAVIYSAGVIPEGGMLDKAAAFIMAGLVSLGYINSRTKVKISG